MVKSRLWASFWLTKSWNRLAHAEKFSHKKALDKIGINMIKGGGIDSHGQTTYNGPIIYTWIAMFPEAI